MMHPFSLFMAIILMVYCGGNPVPEDDFSTVWASPVVHIQSEDYRLPKNVIPVSYKMLLTPDLKNEFTFDGESEIVIGVIAKTTQIVLHANDLTIKSTTLTGPNGESIVATSAALNTTDDFLVITVGTELLPETNYTLKLVFDGKLSDDGRGFYRISYEDDHGDLRWSAATRLEPTSARRAFPCWDEPHLKATFDISIRHQRDFHAISNMHAIATEVDQKDSTHNITTFATTPRMSTYLVAFVVTDFESSSNEDKSFRIWTKPSDIQRGNFFINSARKMLEEFESYTGISYASHGLNKMEAVAIFPPGSQSSGVENWGLVTFANIFLPITKNSDASKGAYGMMHEFAHQWFGNLVTPKRWQYLWLSEGMATYLGFLITDKVWPQWRYKDLQVIVCLQHVAFRADSDETAVALNHNVHSPTEIQGKFNEISYFKAASVIRMIAHVLGEANFQIAVKKYLNKMKFKAATSDDLFEEFVNVFPITTGLTVNPIDILNNWANTPGFPVINVTRDYEKNTMNVTQRRFLNKLSLSHTETYYVPINYATLGEKDFDDITVTNWLDKNEPVTEIEGNFVKNEWIIVNKQQFGYYRVNYDEQNWNMISDFLQSKNYTDVHVINRAQLVDDALVFAKNGELRWDVAFNVIQFLKQEVDYGPWYSACRHLLAIQRDLANTDFDRSFKNYIVELTENVLMNITFNESLDDADFTKVIRRDIVYLACSAGSKICRDKASVKMINWLQDPKMNIIPSDMQLFVLCNGVRNADQVAWDQLFAKYLAGRKKYLLGVLGCTADVEILKKYLYQPIDRSWSSSDRQNVFGAAVFQSEKGVDVFLDFIIGYADKIYELSGNSTDELETYILWLGKMIGREEQLNKLKNASNEHVKSVSADAIRAAQERLVRMNKYREDFAEFFERKSPVLKE